MRFEQGNKYGKGRPKGSDNVLSGDLKAKLGKILAGDWKLAAEDFNQLKPYQRWRIRLEIYNYFLAKMRAVEISGELDGVSDLQADHILTELKRAFVEEKFKNRTLHDIERDSQ